MAETDADIYPRGSYIEFPSSESYCWPGSETPVSLRDAFAAVVLGNARILARYLRQLGQPDPIIIRAIADLLDPSASRAEGEQYHDLRECGSVRSDSLLDVFQAGFKVGDQMVDLWEDAGCRADWKLMFARPHLGKPKSRTLNISWIGRTIEARLGDPPKVEAAVVSLIAETGLSRSTAYRAWESYQCKKQEFEKAWDSLDESSKDLFEDFLKSIPRRF
jgi:hypothetical protein